MLTLLKDIYYSFPIQLLLLSLRRFQLLLFFWVFLTIIIIGKFGVGVGMPSVFLDPEYLGKVGYLSFAIVGIGFGAMYVCWNLVIYILNSYRFPFMASLQYPLAMFFINNSIIPFLFIVSYFIAIIHHQTLYEYQTAGDLTLDVLGFAAGFVLVLLLTGVYFGLINTNTGSYIEANKENIRNKRKPMRKVSFDDRFEPANVNRVDYYITNRLNVMHTRTVEHYDPKLHQLVFRRHHFNAFLAFIAALGFLIAIGFYLENPIFQIPIAASAFLFLSILMSLFGLFLYWTGGWGTAAIIVFVLIANQLTKYDLMGYQSRVYGINYDTIQAPYTLDALRTLASDSNIANDKKYFLNILENWKAKNTDPRRPNEKPVMYFINCSGGGLRSAMFVTTILQHCDSMSKGQLLDKTFMISGASGGMIGVTQLRELFLKKKNGLAINMYDRQHAINISKDVLNPVALSILSNDALLPYHKFKVGNYEYFKDRGYILERTLCENMEFRFDKTLDDYRKDEYDAKIPLLVHHTAIMNDSRRYYITPHPVSFLMRPNGKHALDNNLEIDAVDFCKFFEQQDGKKLLVTSAVRMDATFPFILPNPVLPSNPPTYVMDGGALDNFGIETTLRFLKTFNEWINENTGGVVIIQIRDAEKIDEPEEATQKTLFSKFADPLGTVYNNMENMQDFLTDHRLDDMDEELKGKLKFILFEYTTDKNEEKAAMSFHLTQRDKENILRSVNRPNNLAAFSKLELALYNTPLVFPPKPSVVPNINLGK